jgi:hypothetical protein
MLAAAVWIPPQGPVLYDTAWLTLLLVGLFVCLLALAIAAPMRPVRRPRTQAEAAVEAHEEAVAAKAFGVFFWVLIAGLLIAVVVSFLV